MRLAVFTDAFPVLSETFVVNEIRALRRLGHDVTVVAGRPGTASSPGSVGHSPTEAGLADLVLADVPRARRVLDGARLVARSPRRCAADLADRRRWRPAEVPRHLHGLAPAARLLRERGVEHLHVHFAAHAALDALRLGRILGLPVSITAHAYEIFLHPLNLERKLRRAAFTTSGCDYNVRHLRSLVEPEHAARIHEIVMGVDGREFRRTTPHSAGGHVVAIGRLVEKKGFADLVEATRIALDAGAPIERVTIVGEGPLREALEAQIAARGLGEVVALPGSRSPAEIRDLLETAALLAMPCVVAADGDRDSMPVVVKEAMAMEVPVIATNEVGLPELVDDAVGRLVAPHDPAALAAAIGDLLALGVDARARLGRAGRERALERCDVDRETAKLADLIRGAA